jgi:hypothetical protein
MCVYLTVVIATPNYVPSKTNAVYELMYEGT